MNVALDTNILAYFQGINDEPRYQAAVRLIARLPAATTFVPAQVLGELFVVLVRKGGKSSRQAHESLTFWLNTFPVISTTPEILMAAADLAEGHGLRFWDATVLAAAAHAECELLLTEDLHDGFTWRGVTVVNPFAAVRNPLLDAALASTADDS